MNISEFIYEKKKAEKINEAQEYSHILNFVRNHINDHYREELTGDLITATAKDRYQILIQQTISDNSLFMQGYTQTQLIELLYNSMAKYDLLTPFLECNCGNLPDNPLFYTWEEINCNRYDDIEIVAYGKYVKYDRVFESAENCVDIVRRLARIGGLNLDKSNPRGDSYIGNSIRITATVPPCVDADAGAAFSIRRQKPITDNKEFFLKNGTAIEDELDFLTMCLNNGISVGFAGGTASGKTTDINYLLNNVDYSNRIYTVEDTRELNLVKKDENGFYLSRVVHTVTKDAKDEAQSVVADDLVKDALRYDPDIIGLGEMRGKEAKTTIITGGTDHTIITGLHAAGPRSAYRRITTLYMDASTNLSEKMVYENIVEAIPIMVHKKAFKSGERRYMTITEAVLDKKIEDAEITFNTIYRYVVKDFKRDENGRIMEVIGKHKKVGNISDALAQRLFDSGVCMADIKRFAAENFEPGREYIE